MTRSRLGQALGRGCLTLAYGTMHASPALLSRAADSSGALYFSANSVLLNSSLSRAALSPFPKGYNARNLAGARIAYCCAVTLDQRSRLMFGAYLGVMFASRVLCGRFVAE